MPAMGAAAADGGAALAGDGDAATVAAMTPGTGAMLPGVVGDAATGCDGVTGAGSSLDEAKSPGMLSMMLMPAASVRKVT